MSSIGEGSWSTEGINTVYVENTTNVRCESSHLTSFAVLVDVAGGHSVRWHQQPLCFATCKLCLSSHAFTGYTASRDICTEGSVVHWLCNIHLVSLAHGHLLPDVWVCYYCQQWFGTISSISLCLLHLMKPTMVFLCAVKSYSPLCTILSISTWRCLCCALTLSL